MRQLLVIALLAGVAHADDLSARATAGYNQVRGDAQNTDTFDQVYDLRFERRVSAVIKYLLAVRAQDDLGSALLEGVRQDYQSREVRPLALLQWTGSSLNLQLGYDLTWNQTLTEGNAAPARLMQHALMTASINASDSLRLATDVQWLVQRQGQDVDTSEVRGEALATWKSRTVTLTGGGTGTVYQDAAHDFKRVGVGALTAASWSDSFDDGKVTVTLGNNAQWNLLRESSGSTMATEQAKRELPAAGLYAVDRTPLDSRDAALEPVPALLDSDFAAPTDIDLGPSGVDYQALGVDMGRFVTFDELRIDVRSQAGNAVPRGGDILFDVYVSADARDWQLLEGAPTVDFVAASSAYVIGFPAVSTRYLKVVTFGVNSLDTRVTELETFSHSAFGAAEDRVSQTAIESVQVGFNFAPWKRLRLNYTGLFNLSLTRPQTGSDITGLDWAQTCALTAGLTTWLEAQAGLENRRASQSGAVIGAWNLVSAQLTLVPAPTFTATARATRLMATEAEGSSDTDEARLTLYTRFLPSLDSSFELGRSRQAFDPPLDRTIDRTYASWLGNAQLTRTLRLTGNVTLQRTTASDRSESDLAGKDYRGYGEATWRLSQQLLLAARLGWAVSDLDSGVLQRYRVDWHPFPGGALNLGFSYDEDQQSMTGYRSRRVSLFPSWSINRHAILNFNYTLIQLSGPTGTQRNELLFLLLTLNT